MRPIQGSKHNGSGRSGLRMEGRVRIPLLTLSFSMTIFFSVAIVVRVTEGLSHQGFRLLRARVIGVGVTAEGLSYVGF